MLEVALYIVSGLTLYAGGHHLYLGGNPASKQPHVQLGLLYLLLSAFALASALTYQSPALQSLLPTGKVAISLGLVLWCALVWHIALRTDFKPWIVLDVITAAWTVFLIQNISSKNSLIYTDVVPLHQTLNNGERLDIVPSQLSPWWSAVEISMLVSLAFCAYAAYRLYRRKQKTTALVIAAGLGLLGLVTLFDHLVSAQLIKASYLTPFGFLGFLLVNSLYPVIQGWREMHKPKQPPMIYNLTFKPDYASFHTDVSQLRTPLCGGQEGDETTAGAVRTSAAIGFPVAEDEEIEDVPGDTLQSIDSDQAEAAKPAAAAVIDETLLNAVTDNLIDIAVYATMALNRFKRGDADPATLEKLCRNVRTRAIKTRRLANRLSQSKHVDYDDSKSGAD